MLSTRRSPSWRDAIRQVASLRGGGSAAKGGNGVERKENPTEDWIQCVRRRFPTEPYVDHALTRKMRRRGGPIYRPAGIGDVRSRLESFLAGRVQGSFEVADLTPLTGGSSKEQYGFRLSTSGPDGKRRTERLVLRLQPAESTVETHRLREFQILNAMRTVIPVPRPLWVDPDGQRLGAPGLIYTFCPGVSRPPAEGQISGKEQAYGERYLRLIAPQFVWGLAQIATAPWQRADLSAFEIPARGGADGVHSGINWWSRVWEEDSVEAVPLMRIAENWLRKNAPIIDHVSVVHGDYRTGNFLFDPESGQITAFLDWELARLGDRHEDLAYTMSPVLGSRDSAGNFLVGGFCTREQFLRDYAMHSRMPVDPDKLAYYEVFQYWRQAIITLATAWRCLVGQKTHQDILVGWSTSVAPGCLQTLNEALRKRL
jgi:aminoglycoside phosphotransferase (APT) family kinase protein